MKENSMKKNFLISFLRTGIMLVVPLLIFPYASRVLGTEGIGRVQYIQSIASYFQLFATFGISSYGIREGSKVKNDKKALGKFCTELFLINLITTSIALIAYFILFGIENFDSYRSLLVLYIFYIIFYGLNLDWIFNVLEDYVYITIRTCVAYGLSIIVLFLFVKEKSSVNMYAVVCILPYIGIFLGNFKNMCQKITMFQRVKYNLKQHIKPMFLVFGIVISSSIYSLLDTTMLGLMRGDSAVGLYTAASKLCRLVVQLITAICAVFLPRLSYYAGKREKEKFRELALTSAELIVCIAVPCSLGLLVLAEQAIVLFSGREFLGAVSATRILAINLFFSALDGFLGWQILVPNNRDKVLLSATIIGAAADFVLNIVLIPKWGVEGAALATFLSEAAVFCVCITYSMKYMDFRKLFVHFRKCIIAILPVFGIGALILPLELPTILSATLIVGSTGIVYFLLLGLLRDELFCSVAVDIKEFLHKRMNK